MILNGMTLSNKFTLARIVYSPIFIVLYFYPVWVKALFPEWWAQEAITFEGFYNTNPSSWTNGDIVAFISPWIFITASIFIQITDYWDGYYARKYNEVSDFGKLFDPFADIFLNLTVFACATTTSYITDSNGNHYQYMPMVFFLLLLWREISMHFIRMVAVSKGTTIAARRGGKVKTVFYIISAFFYLAIESFGRWKLNWLLVEYFDLQSLGFTYAVWDMVMAGFRYFTMGLFVFCIYLSYSSFYDYIKTFASVLKEEKK